MEEICLLSFLAGMFLTVIVDTYIFKYFKRNSHNDVHFYVTRDTRGILELWIGKPKRIYGKYWGSEQGNAVSLLTNEKYINDFNWNKSDFDNLKYEDEPAEVFLNLK